MPTAEKLSPAARKQNRRSEATRRRIYEAAANEFAEHGIAGARVDRIATAAKANKSLIYEYFGSKDELFEMVIREAVAEFYETVGVTGLTIAEYAGKIFDFAMERPRLMRLVMWRGFAGKRDFPLPEGESLARQLERIEKAQAGGCITKQWSADVIYTMLLTIATSWTATNAFGPAISQDVDGRREELRRSVCETVEKLFVLPAA
ncbi:TetR/AcrR family transcriptional regulator [Sutterella sp.]|uniref:TetR/AcrR family transcriptional regulator n=1 Tax=Sutterella sp. TaxID=1981025 RepID=UPI0026E06DE3|nr:TetR family transcriptional regulator [Sutterella sp.]MDO5531802.1 TetR family transcriptional regulator [Sutterella sp.]